MRKANQKPVDLHHELRGLIHQSEAAQLLGWSRFTIWKKIRQGKLKAVKVYSMVWVPRADVTAILRQREQLAEERKQNGFRATALQRCAHCGGTGLEPLKEERNV